MYQNAQITNNFSSVRKNKLKANHCDTDSALHILTVYLMDTLL